jgi:hypothetical protein
MEHVIVERTFDQPFNFEDLQAAEHRASWCLDQYRVRFLRSYFSGDRKRMICVYEAPDAESVRHANRQAGLPFDSIWTASVYGPSQ